ncbi:hypothetical protein Nepgr_013167 [Nepenthes gracilis]|uniref:DRBM domain-containing protein n=1 Tax=Nepenthes gracilis TaxID=150966 RepID=A0AAD3XP11_NEPGR|nr:hypothetical protein Nepgr_013167 [Nepenthes gracilis]
MCGVAQENFENQVCIKISCKNWLREAVSTCHHMHAEHAAAEVALNMLANGGPSKALAAKVLDETGVYKNLLQETAHRAGLNLPVYTTVRSGLGHVPFFSCMVELAGMTFTGEPAKTKKQAQKNAAMIAWSALKQMSQHGSSSPPLGPGCHEERVQTIVARFLATRNREEWGNSPSNDTQKTHHKSPMLAKSLPSTPHSFHERYPNGPAVNPSPAISIYFTWLHQQAAEQQNRLLALPVSPVPSPSHAYPLLHSFVRPSYHSYFLPRDHQPIAVGPMLTFPTAGLSSCFPNPFAADDIRSSPMATIEETQVEKTEDLSKLCRPKLLNPSAVNSTRPVTGERVQIDNMQNDGLPDAKIGGRGRLRIGGSASRFKAPAVKIRSVVPVCSSPGTRKMAGTGQGDPPSHGEVKNRETELSSKLDDLHI